MVEVPSLGGGDGVGVVVGGGVVGGGGVVAEPVQPAWRHSWQLSA